MKAKVATYTVLAGIGLMGLLICLYVAKSKTFEIWELVLSFLMLPLFGLVMWFRDDWMRGKVRDLVDKAERDWSQP